MQYITTYNNARELITQLDRDEIGCHILEEYFGTETFNKEDFNFDDNEFLMKGLTDRYLAVASGAARYLNGKQDGSLPKSSNVIPYCIGYGEDGKFRRCLNRNMPFGYETRSMLLPLPFLKKKFLDDSVLPMFQQSNGV